TGRASSRGNPAIRAGIVVTLEASDRRFDGKYYVTSVRHRYRHQGGHGGGFTTDFDFRRDAAGDVQAKKEQEAQKQQQEAKPQPPPQQQKPKEPETDWIEVTLVGEDDKPIANARYRLKLPSGD